MLKHPMGISVAFDQLTANFWRRSAEKQSSQSEIMRRALQFSHENKMLWNAATRKKICTYMDLLLNGEHVILDLRSLASFLRTSRVLS